MRSRFIVLCFALLAFSFAQQDSANAALGFGKKSKDTKKETVTPQSSPKPAAAKPAAEPSSEAEGNDAENVNNLVPDIPRFEKIESGSEYDNGVDIPSSGYTKPSIPSQDMEILRIQKQIQEIIHINDDLKSRYKNQATEIQKIGDQAKIHQKILEDLNKSRPSNLPAESIVKKEKLKVIETETAKSQDFINQLEKGAAAPAKTSPQAPSKAPQAR